MMKSDTVLLFTRLMAELTKADMPLHTALHAIVDMHSVPLNVKQTAYEVKQQLEKGTSFSLALAQCTVASFGSVYVAFVSSAQETGFISETFSFLLQQEEQKAQRRAAVASLCVYPFVVIFAACVGSALLVKLGSSIVPNVMGTFNEALYKRNAIIGFIKALSFLCIFAVSGAILLKFKMGRNAKLDLFRALTFLTKAGVDLNHALETALPVVQTESRVERYVLQVLTSLEQGRTVSESFAVFGSECALSLEMAQNSSSLYQTFSHLTKVYEEREKRTVKRCVDFVEPSVMCAVAVFLIILLKSVIMPVLYSYGL